MTTDQAIKSAIREAKTSGKVLRRCYERGMYIEVHPNGSALWRYKYAFAGRENLVSLGSYLDVPLKRARERRDEERKLVADGVDPSAQRKAAKVAQANSVELVSEEWLAKQTDLDPGTVKRHRGRLEKFIFPHIGKRAISTVTAADLLAPLRRIDAAGKRDTAKRTRELCGAIWRYAIATSRADRDISVDLKGALAPAVSKNHAALTEPRG